MQHSKGLSIGSPFVLLKKKTPVRMSEGGMWGSSPQLGKPEPVTRCAVEVHVDDVEDKKRHEKMLQIMHGLVQRPHERYR